MTAACKPLSPNQLSLKIMSVNIRIASPMDGVNIWDNRKSWLVDYIQFEELDVFGTQEVQPEQLEYLQKYLPKYANSGKGRNGGKTSLGEKDELIPVFYKKEKFLLLDEGTFWLSETPDVPGSIGWDARHSRMVSWVKLKDKKSEKMLLFFNTHFDHKGEVARLESAKLLTTKLEKIAGEYSFFVVGDFNMAPVSEPYNVLVEKNDSENGFKDAFKEASKGYGPSYTYNGFKLEPKKEIPRADYISYKGDVNIKRFQVVDAQRGALYMSYHFPVVTEVLIN